MYYQQTRTLNIPQKTALLNLWNREAPTNIAHDSISSLEGYLNSLEDARYTLVLDDEQQINGWFVDFNREGERWFAMLLDTSIQGHGVGSELLNRVKAFHNNLNGWVIDHNNDKKINGENYRSPIKFYLKNEFNMIPYVRLETDKLSAVKITWSKQY